MAGNTTPFPLIGAIRCYLALTWLGDKMLIGMTTQYGNDLEHGPARWSAGAMLSLKLVKATSSRSTPRVLFLTSDIARVVR
jgi:hypothetical protein